MRPDSRQPYGFHNLSSRSIRIEEVELPPTVPAEPDLEWAVILLAVRPGV